jgi:hypothetical protein
MTVPESGKTWRKSSYSSQGGDCVEIEGSLAAVRDSKRPAAGALTVNVRLLVRAIRSGQLG